MFWAESINNDNPLPVQQHVLKAMSEIKFEKKNYRVLAKHSYTSESGAVLSDLQGRNTIRMWYAFSFGRDKARDLDQSHLSQKYFSQPFTRQ